MSNFTDFGGGGIKSVQRGVIVIPSAALNASATVSPIDMGKSHLSLLGFHRSDGNITPVLIDLVNANTVQARVGVAQGGITISVSWQLVEYT